MPYASPQNVQPKGAGKWGAGGHNYPPQGDFNALFCVLIAPPFDPLLMKTLGAYHNRFVIRAQSEGGFGDREFVCVCFHCLQGDDNSVRQKQTTLFVQ